MAAGFGTASLYLAASGCGPFQEEPHPDDPEGYPPGDSWECLGPEVQVMVMRF